MKIKIVLSEGKIAACFFRQIFFFLIFRLHECFAFSRCLAYLDHDIGLMTIEQLTIIPLKARLYNPCFPNPQYSKL
jgi:hypothetical protein